MNVERLEFKEEFYGSERFQGGIDDVLDATFKSGPALPGAVPFSRLEHIKVPSYHLEARGSYEGFNLLALENLRRRPSRQPESTP